MSDLPPDTPDVDLVYGWSGPILPIGRFAGDLDRRRFQGVSWPSLPLTLADNHQGTEFVGPLDSAEILTVDEIAERVELSDQDREEIGEKALWASGRLARTPEGEKTAGQLAFWGRLPVSVEVRDGDFIESPVMRDGELVGREMDWSRTVVGAVAIERLPAFAGAWIRPDPVAAEFSPDDEDETEEMADAVAALRAEADEFRTAGAGPHAYPAHMFARLDYHGPTRLTISPEGEVTGHVAVWGKAHRAGNGWLAAPCGDLSDWLVGSTLLDNGEIVRTGVIVSDGLHAPAHPKGITSREMTRLIESTATQVITANAWEDEWGTAVHGSTLPGVTPEQATRAMAGCPSLDQRDFGDGRGFVTCGVLMVNTCGFTPGDAVVSVENGEPVRRLVASAGVPEGCGCGGTCGGSGCVTERMVTQAEELHRQIIEANPGITITDANGGVIVGDTEWTWATGGAGNAGGYITRAASGTGEPDPEPVVEAAPVVDLAALAAADRRMAEARLKAATAPRPKR